MKNITLFGIIFLSFIFARRDCLQQAELDALGRSSRPEKDTVVIRNKVYFEQITAVLDVPVDEISYLNPTYKTGFIPGIPGESYVLTLPANKIGDFINNEKVSYTNLFGVVVYLIGIYLVKKYHQEKKNDL